MITSKVMVTCVTFASLLFIASTVGFSLRHTPPALAVEAKDSRVKTLLREKLSIAQKVAAQKTELYRAEAGSRVEVYEANQAVLNAELELCETTPERIAMLTKMLAEAVAYEKMITGHPSIPSTTVLMFKISRLDIEIALERAKER